MRYALRFAQDSGHFFSGFRSAEIASLCQVFKITDIKLEQKKEDIWIVASQCQKSIENIISRSVLLKSVIKLFCYADTENKLFQTIRGDASLSSRITEELSKSTNGFKVLISTVNKTIKAAEKLVIIENLLGCLPSDFECKINLKYPQVVLHLLEDFDYHSGTVRGCYLGISLPCSERGKITSEFDIRKRCFIGNTTMDPLLSALMSNLACVKNGDLILDPFIGTGGIVLLCAYHGAFVLGSDLDYKTIHAISKPSRAGLKGKRRSSEESIRTNFAQHSFEERFLDVFVNDASDVFWKRDLHFDAILTDPPYGIREGIKTINSDVKVNSIESHASMQQQSPIHMFKQLVNFSAKHLKLSGRLVFWMPFLTSRVLFDPDEHVPKHPAMKLVHFCSQKLKDTSSRALVCLEKVSEEPSLLDCDSHVNSDYYNLGPEVSFREAYLNSA